MSSKFNYQSHIPKVKYALTEIEKACLKEIGRYVRDEARERSPFKTGRLKKNISYQIRRKDKSVRLGVRGKAFYGMFFEFGTRKLKKRPFLTPAVEENIDHIRLIAGKYFKEIEKDNIAIGLLGPDDGERDDS